MTKRTYLLKSFVGLSLITVGVITCKKLHYDKKEPNSSLLRQNVEALSEAEESSPCPNGYRKYKTEKPYWWSDKELFTYCNGCEDREGYSPSEDCK